MSSEYKAEQKVYAEKLISNLLQDCPLYVSEFYRYMHSGRRSISTQLSYIRDVVDFLSYEKSILPQYKETPLSKIPVFLFDSLQLQDLNEYRDYLKITRELSNASSKKIFASVSAFYKFLNMYGYTKNNPMYNFEFPIVNKKRLVKLDANLSTQLLEGILANDKYLIETDEFAKIVTIDDNVRIKREKLVLRNYAICCLFLGSGLRVSELVGLDLSDINFQRHSLTIIAKGGDEIEVFFGDEVAIALQNYLFGQPVVPSFSTPFEESSYEWVKAHKADEKFIENLEKEFPSADDRFKRQMSTLRFSLLRQGRAALMPKKGCEAVFITTRGTRMSVRSVELMIKEMARTYLPDYADKDKFSPHKLRATCATRILTQTGDINLASTQLNHKGIAVTADFYAQIKKEQQKEQISKLDIGSW